MAQSIALTRPVSFSGIATGFFRAVGNVLVASMEVNSRLRAVRQLRAKTDAELADIGLQRNDIHRQVFGTW